MAHRNGQNIYHLADDYVRAGGDGSIIVKSAVSLAYQPPLVGLQRDQDNAQERRIKEVARQDSL